MIQGFLADLAVKLLTFVYGKVSEWLSRAIELKRKYDSVREKNAAVRKQTEAATTKEERDDATKNIIDNF